MAELIAVTGTNGWIGHEVCRWLECQNYTVRRLTRTGLPGTARLDLTMNGNDAQWLEALNGCTTMVHCAAHVHRPLETETERALFQAVNIDGTEKLLTACIANGVRRIVLASSSAIYDWSKGISMTENCVIQPNTAYAVSKLRAENIVQATALDWRIARLATVYGSGDTANFWRLAHALKTRRFMIPGHGDARKSVLTVRRAGEMLGRMAIQEGGERAILNLGSPVAPTLRKICDDFSRCCGFANAPTAPLWLLRSGARLGDTAQQLGLPALLTTDTLTKLTTSTVIDVTQMLRHFPDLDWPDFGEELAGVARYYAAS